MRNKLLFALKCSLPLFIGGMVLNSCKDDSPVSGFKEEEGEYVYFWLIIKEYHLKKIRKEIVC